MQGRRDLSQKVLLRSRFRCEAMQLKWRCTPSFFCTWADLKWCRTYAEKKSACKTRATRRSELGYPTVVASLTISSPKAHQCTAGRAARLLTALIVQNMCRPSPSSPSPSCWLSGKNTHVRTYARTAYAVQEPQYTVASSRLVNYQGAMADCTEASELFATIAVRSN